MLDLLLSLPLLFPLSAGTTWVVDPSGGGDFITIQDAIASPQVGSGHTVLVRAGHYSENLNLLGKAIVIQAESGPSQTVVDGGGVGSVVVFENGEDNRTVLEGFTLTRGSATYGGGVYCDAASPIIQDCLIVTNTAIYGGGVYTKSIADPILRDCTMDTNSANAGGGLYADYWSAPQLVDCTMTDNDALWYGGGVGCFQSAPSLVGCELSRNTAGEGAGLYAVDYSAVALDGCLVVENVATHGGGCTIEGNAYLDMVNSTVAANTALYTGGGLVLLSATVDITGCIVSGNQASGAPGLFLNSTTQVSATWSCIEGGSGQSWFGTGCIDVDPLFVPGSYFLSQMAAGQSADSNCVDAGDPAVAPPFGTTRTDLAHDVGVPDMGYHLSPPGPSLAVTNFVSGQVATVTLSLCTPQAPTLLAWSVAGPGPTPTQFGPAYVGRPFQLVPLTADAAGSASTNQLIPPGLAGLAVWLHAVDLSTGILSNPLASVVQ